jgi:hypothetical protein
MLPPMPTSGRSACHLLEHSALRRGETHRVAARVLCLLQRLLKASFVPDTLHPARRLLTYASPVVCVCLSPPGKMSCSGGHPVSARPPSRVPTDIAMEEAISQAACALLLSPVICGCVWCCVARKTIAVLALQSHVRPCSAGLSPRRLFCPQKTVVTL